MNSLKKIQTIKSIPLLTAMYLSDIGISKGHQKLYESQSPEIIKKLIEHAVIESAVSSNRIEGVEIEHHRIIDVLGGKTELKDRSEEEVAGYRKCLDKIHHNSGQLEVSQETIRLLHSMSRGQIWDSGQYREKNVDIVQNYEDGRSRIRFKTVDFKDIEIFMSESLTYYENLHAESLMHPLLIALALNFDFLCIHPFRDGNGRVSRLLYLLTCHQAGYQVGKFISLEKLIEENKERYYETLEISSQGWHEGKHDPWPYINFMLYILKTAYNEFEQRAGKQLSQNGSKSSRILSAINQLPEEFSVRDIEIKCLGVSRELIRKIIKKEKGDGNIISKGKGPGALWEKRVKKE